MRSQTTHQFWKCFNALPEETKRHAVVTYQRWRESPYHPSVHFKKVSQRTPIYSVRIGIHYRALGLWENEVITWFWIGSHRDYEKLVKNV